MPPAARATDNHVCPLVQKGEPHVGGPVSTPLPSRVKIGFQPAARSGDVAACVGAMDVIVGGSATVFIDNRPAARLGDATAHGGAIAGGCPSVLIGGDAQADTLRTDKAFCEECERRERGGEV